MITSNRGLAGGYNSNIVKLVTGSELKKEDVEVYAIGKKGRDVLKRRGYNIKADYSEVINEPLYKDAMEECLGIPVKECLIYSIYHGTEIEVFRAE